MKFLNLFTLSSIRHSRFNIPLIALIVIVVGLISGGVVATIISHKKSSSVNYSIVADPSLTSAYVKRNGSQFSLDGKEFKFVGFNYFDAAGIQGGPYSCLKQNGWFPKFSQTEFEQALQAMRDEGGASVLRFWAFQKYALRPDGTLDWAGIHNAVDTAKKYGFKVLPVLEDGPGYCTEPAGGASANPKWHYMGDTWYSDGYKVTMPGYKYSYQDYVKAIVTEFKDDPAILGWMMMNEADTSKKTSAGDSILTSFATDMGQVIKTIDKKHLLTVGTQSNGASGGTGSDFLKVHSVTGTVDGIKNVDLIDFAEGHDWPFWAKTADGNEYPPFPGFNVDDTGKVTGPMTSTDCTKQYMDAKIGCSVLASVQKLNKPFVMGEAGVRLNSDSQEDMNTRAAQVGQKTKAFFANGGAGYVYWQWNKVMDGERYDLRYDTVSGFKDSALLTVLKQASQGFLKLTDRKEMVLPPTTATPAVEIPSIPVGLNLLKNSDFSNFSNHKFSDWTLQTNSANGASITAIDGRAVIKMNDAAGKSSDVQLVQSFSPIRSDKSYALSFEARASDSRAITSVIQKNGTDVIYSKKQQTISKEWVTYQYIFNVNSSDDHVSLIFNVAGSAGEISFDNVKLIEVGSLTSPGATLPSPTPAQAPAPTLSRSPTPTPTPTLTAPYPRPTPPSSTVMPIPSNNPPASTVTPEQPSTTSLTGFLNGINNGTVAGSTTDNLIGWAADSADTSTAVLVYIYVDSPMVNGRAPDGIVIADKSKAEVSPQNHNFAGNHGFYWQIPTKFKDYQGHIVYTYAVTKNGAIAKHLSNSPNNFQLR